MGPVPRKSTICRDLVTVLTFRVFFINLTTFRAGANFDLFLFFPEFKPVQQDQVRYRLDETHPSAPSGGPHLKKENPIFQKLAPARKVVKFIKKTRKVKTVTRSRQIVDFRGTGPI